MIITRRTPAPSFLRTVIPLGFFFPSAVFFDLLEKKRIRARVPIAGQCILLQISIRIKMFDFFKWLKLLYESHILRHTSEPLKKIGKILETMRQSN